MGKHFAAAAAALAALGFGLPAAGQDISGPPCEEMSGQAVINGVLQQVQGLACLQPDGSWQMVDTGDAGVITYAAPYYDPWYWAPYGVAFGGVIFIDRFHHAHHVAHAFFRAPGMRVGGGFRGGFHGGGFHGGGGGFHGGFHGGGGGGGGGGHH
ncbi:hypothetical protein AB4Z48_03330 [Cupriavidus sp. 2TAF22]|uniref:hypothetical protein n=1 Tax=unclassified Cupriavidus TaxID=2640874 RepID=UPI003F9278B9